MKYACNFAVLWAEVTATKLSSWTDVVNSRILMAQKEGYSTWLRLLRGMFPAMVELF